MTDTNPIRPNLESCLHLLRTPHRLHQMNLWVMPAGKAMPAPQVPAPLRQGRTRSLVTWKEPWTASRLPSLYRQKPCDPEKARGSVQGHTAAQGRIGTRHDGFRSRIYSASFCRAPAGRRRAPAPAPLSEPLSGVPALTRRHATQRREAACSAYRRRHGGALSEPL